VVNGGIVTRDSVADFSLPGLLMRIRHRGVMNPCNGHAGKKQAALSLPDILAAGAGDGFRRMLLFQGILANRTVFLPHNYTWLPSRIGLK
jgi:hypothetical protein